MFFAAYAETTPLFSVFGVKANIILVLALLAAFSVRTFSACAFLVSCATLGLMSGVGFIQSAFFFSAIFLTVQGIRRVVPWQPFLSACVLVLFFSFFTYVSLDWDLMMRSAPQFALEAFYNLIVMSILYACIPPYYARQGRY